MIKKYFTIFAIMLIASSMSFAQWENMGAFPDTSYHGGTHGIAVDPDGKVWVASYFNDVNWITPDNDTIATSAILVFNADGSVVDTLLTVTTGSDVDTLSGHCRGLETDHEGNILYVQSGPSKIIKINYQTLEGMGSHVMDEIGTSPTSPSVSSDGTIYVGPVVGGGTNAITMYDSDLNYLGNAVVGPPNIGRTLEVSADGNTIYWMPFTAAHQGMYIYTRPDEFSDYALADSALQGMSIETSAWHPTTGNLWVSHDARGESTSLTHLTWYEVLTIGSGAVENSTLGQSFTWVTNDDATEFPRGLDFSPDGSMAYVGTFATATARIQKFGLAPTSVEKLDDAIPNGYELSQNYPNPFNPTTKIKFAIPETGLVTVKIFDILGQEVAELVNEVKVAGSYKIEFDASNLTSGMYIYKISAGKFNATRKMMLLK